MIIDGNNRILHANRAIAEKLGAAPGDLTGRHCYEVIHGTTAPPDFCPHPHTMAMGRAQMAELSEEHLGGDFLVSTLPLLDESGRVTSVAHVMRDVSSLKAAERAHAESAARYRALFDGISSGVAVYEAVEEGRDFIFRDFNRAAEEIEGVTREEIIGRRVTEVFPGVEEFDLLEVFRRVWESGKSEHHPPSLYRDERHFGWRENRVFKLPGGEVVAVYDDVTERVWADDTRAALNRMRLLELSEKPLERVLEEVIECLFIPLWTEEEPRGCVFLIEDDPGVLVMAAGRGIPERNREECARVPVGRCVCGRAVRSGTIETAGPGDAPRGRGCLGDGRSNYCIPLIAAGGTIGVINLCVSGGYPLSERQSDFFRAAADLASALVQQRRGREELVESEERFRAISESAMDAVVMMNGRGRIVVWNRAASKMFGYSADEVKGRDLHELLAPERYRAAYRRGIDYFRTTGMGPVVGRRLELAGLKKDGAEFPIELSVSPVKVRGEWHAIGILRDISARREAEEKLRRSEARFRLAAESLSDILYVWEVSTGRLEWIGDVDAMLGYGPGEFPRTLEAWLKSIHPGDRGAIEEVVKKHARESSPYRVEYRIRRKDGSWLHWADRGVPLSTGEGEPLSYIGSITDFTEQRHLREQLLHVQKMEAIGTLAGGLAHDFNNILAGILGYASLIKRRMGPLPALKDMGVIERLAMRGADITKSLMAFARREGESRREVFNIRGVIEGVAKVVGTTVGANVEIIRDIPKDLHNIEGDRGQIHQALMNVCINACEAMPRGGRLTVTARNAEPGSDFFRLHPDLARGPYVSVEFADIGAGMDAETKRRIFEPFFTTKSEKVGTGLGLAMVIGIVEGHGGCVEVRSEPGKGSVFTLYFPAARRGKAGAEREAKPVPRGRETILLIDDEKDFRKSVGKWLGELGYTVLKAASGREGLEIARERKAGVDLVILDMIMKGMDGAEVFEALRKIRGDMPILICTGYSLQEEREELLEKGNCCAVMKPVGPEALAREVRRLLDGAGPRPAEKRRPGSKKG